MTTQNERLYGVRDQKKKTVYDFILEYTREKYDLRYDELGHDFQISFKGRNQWELLDTHSFLIELAQSSIEVTPARLESFLRAHFTAKFKPIAEYFRSVRGWQGEDHIKELVS